MRQAIVCNMTFDGMLLLIVSAERLQFLDTTLERMIRRFEDEYPECRIDPPLPKLPAEESTSDSGSLPSSFTSPWTNQMAAIDPNDIIEDDEQAVKVPMSRHNSDVSLASRFLTQEEGQMHRFGQQIRRDVLRPQFQDYAHGTTGHEVEAEHLQELRARIDQLSGDEIKERVERLGPDAALRELGVTAKELWLLQRQDPESLEKFGNTQLMTEHNLQGHIEEASSEAIV